VDAHIEKREMDVISKIHIEQQLLVHYIQFMGPQSFQGPYKNNMEHTIVKLSQFVPLIIHKSANTFRCLGEKKERKIS
jgi:hypothetical protein